MNNDTLCIVIIGILVTGALYLYPEKGVILAGQVVAMFFAYMRGNYDGKKTIKDGKKTTGED